MNVRTGSLPILFTALVACSGNNAPDSDVLDSDTVVSDTLDAVEKQIYPGALPTLEFRDLAVTPADDVLIDDNTDARTLTAVHMTTDGVTVNTTEIFKKEYDYNVANPIRFTFTPLETEVLAGMSETQQEYGDLMSYQDAFINHNGNIQWEHQAS